MKFPLRFAVWLLLSVFVLSLSSCAELALPREQLYPPLAASSIIPDEGLIVNIAPTPSPAPYPAAQSANHPATTRRP